MILSAHADTYYTLDKVWSLFSDLHLFKNIFNGCFYELSPYLSYAHPALKTG